MRRLANGIFALILAPLLLTTWASGQAPSARPGAAAAVDRTVLPPPDPSFRGKIDVALKDSKAGWPEPLRAPKGAPNVLLIMGDDIGYAHMSAFGGPANTPTFDRLAKQGLRFTNFHTTAVCSASRAALLTGRNAHSVGMGSTPEGSHRRSRDTTPASRAAPPPCSKSCGRTGTAPPGSARPTSPPCTKSRPQDRSTGGRRGMGAEYFYGFFGPGVSQWYPPLWENTTPIRAPKTPEEGYHLEADMADQTVAFIQRQKSMHPEKPWIAYYAPNGHKPPIGVPREFIEKYRGKFDDGYDKLRERILARQKELGIVPADTKLAPRPAVLPPWDSLTDTDKKVGARWMEVFTGAVEHTDYQIGRIVEAIEQTGELDNTLIIYIAGDNGPTPEGGLHGIMNKLTYMQRRPGVARRPGEADRRLRRPEVARLQSRRLELRHVHAVHLRQIGDLGRRQQHGHGDLLAGAHQGQGRHPPAVPLISSTWSRPSWRASGCRSRSASTASTRSRWKG